MESDRLGGRTHHHPHLRLESPYQWDCRHPGAFQEVEPDFITLWGVVVSSMGGEFAEIQALVRDKTGETVGRRDGLRRELVGLPWWSNGLRFLAPSAGGLGLIPGQRTRFYMLQLRVCMMQGIWLAQPNKYILKKKKKRKKTGACDQAEMETLPLSFIGRHMSLPIVFIPAHSLPLSSESLKSGD